MFKLNLLRLETNYAFSLNKYVHVVISRDTFVRHCFRSLRFSASPIEILFHQIILTMTALVFPAFGYSAKPFASGFHEFSDFSSTDRSRKKEARLTPSWR